jgi:hypothetical protein
MSVILSISLPKSYELSEGLGSAPGGAARPKVPRGVLFGVLKTPLFQYAMIKEQSFHPLFDLA